MWFGAESADRMMACSGRLFLEKSFAIILSVKKNIQTFFLEVF